MLPSSCAHSKVIAWTWLFFSTLCSCIHLPVGLEFGKYSVDSHLETFFPREVYSLPSGFEMVNMLILKDKFQVLDEASTWGCECDLYWPLRRARRLTHSLSCFLFHILVLSQLTAQRVGACSTGCCNQTARFRNVRYPPRAAPSLWESCQHCPGVQAAGSPLPAADRRKERGRKEQEVCSWFQDLGWCAGTGSYQREYGEQGKECHSQGNCKLFAPVVSPHKIPRLLLSTTCPPAPWILISN